MMDFKRRIKKIEDSLGLGLRPIDLRRYAKSLISNLTVGLTRFGLSEAEVREFAQQESEYAVECIRKYGPGWKTKHRNGSPLNQPSQAVSA